MSIVFKAGAGLAAGVVAGMLGLAFLPRVEPSALKPRSAVEKPQFVVAPPVPSVAPQPAATLAVATETAVAKPSAAPAPTPDDSAQRHEAALRLAALAPPATSSPPLPEKQSAVAAISADPPKADAPPPLKPAPEDAARWSVHGLVALAKGDLSLARLFLARAAEAGDARAWVALADTYDPAMLAKLGVVFAPGDAQRARDCLVKAMAAGVVVPKDRLAALDPGAQPLR